jgi:hypothetical protein
MSSLLSEEAVIHEVIFTEDQDGVSEVRNESSAEGAVAIYSAAV